MVEIKDYKNMGMASLILAIIGFFVLFFFNRFIGLTLGIIALILGYISKKHGDINGLYGFYISLVIVIFMVISAIVYVYVSSMLG
ncbi:MAG: hypothetical protein QHH19_04425 [Candidatus Thermoplasmatota archaeon]|nr:hypothetical protein [Candidatus Thermoplasmatota archaeon]